MHEGVRLVWYDSNNVIPAKAGIQKGKYLRRNGLLDSRLRGNDEGRAGLGAKKKAQAQLRPFLEISLRGNDEERAG
jgi:hypothetical protein